jgi:hypothetical protein
LDFTISCGAARLGLLLIGGLYSAESYFGQGAVRHCPEAAAMLQSWLQQYVLDGTRWLRLLYQIGFNHERTSTLARSRAASSAVPLIFRCVNKISASGTAINAAPHPSAAPAASDHQQFRPE